MKAESPAVHPGLLLAAHAACFWPVWSWYMDRMDDGSDEPWAIIALLAALALSWPRAAFRLYMRDGLIAAAAVITALYAALLPFAPPLVRAVLAMVALGCSWVSLGGAREKSPVIICLLGLSVPVLATLQFYAGYPLRALTAAGATGLLNLFGAEVERAGTIMLAGGKSVLVDAPCSGVRMLWTGSVLCCVLAGMRARVTWSGMAVALACVAPIVLAANVLRAALLFLIETARQPMPAYLHEGVGVLTFALVGVALLGMEAWHAHRQKRRVRHAMTFSWSSP